MHFPGFQGFPGLWAPWDCPTEQGRSVNVVITRTSPRHRGSVRGVFEKTSVTRYHSAIPGGSRTARSTTGPTAPPVCRDATELPRRRADLTCGRMMQHPPTQSVEPRRGASLCLAAVGFGCPCVVFITIEYKTCVWWYSAKIFMSYLCDTV